MTDESQFIEVDDVHISAIVLGMDAMNEEKREIRMIFSLLDPYLHMMAEEVFSANDQPPGEGKQEMFEVLSLEAEEGGDALCVTAKKGKDGMTVRIAYLRNGRQDFLDVLRGRKSAEPVIAPEGLAKCEVNTCRYILLPILVKRVRQHCPRLAEDIVEFNAAGARRALVQS